MPSAVGRDAASSRSHARPPTNAPVPGMSSQPPPRPPPPKNRRETSTRLTNLASSLARVLQIICPGSAAPARPRLTRRPSNILSCHLADIIHHRDRAQPRRAQATTDSPQMRSTRRIFEIPPPPTDARPVLHCRPDILFPTPPPVHDDASPGCCSPRHPGPFSQQFG